MIKCVWFKKKHSFEQWYNWGGVLVAIALLSRKNLPLKGMQIKLFCLFLSVLYVDKWRGGIGSIVQNLIVNYPLVALCPQKCHIKTNLNYWCPFIISTHVFVLASSRVWFCIFSLNDFNKLLVIVALPNTKQTNWLYKQYHTQTSPCLPSFFQMQ